MGDRRRKQRGAAAIEFALGIPVLLLATAGSISLGRGLMTRHDLAAATGYAARAAAVASGGNPGAVNSGTVDATVRRFMGSEVMQCSSLTIETTTNVPAAFPGAKAVQVTSTCNLKAPFVGDWSKLGIPFVRVTAAMPLL